ncbi:MAG: oxygen-independent coproporphyrinogen III oxidase [Myxococcales bacterium FL481]|nr:MAG: oxygen-independent coproporphyrinogen III oxidase [Myxococcales bacterium FL481]
MQHNARQPSTACCEPAQNMRRRALSCDSTGVQSVRVTADPTTPIAEPTLEALRQRYGGNVPRYTSYPTAVEFHEGFDEAAYRKRLTRASERKSEPWSVYVHIPFCRRRCHFCACSVIATPQHDRVAPRYVDGLAQELEQLDPYLSRRRDLAQLHLGGGTPTYLAPELLARVYEDLAQRFDFDQLRESSVEIDPRVTTPQHLDVIAQIGRATRVSLGVQDLDPDVQDNIGREQTREQTHAIVSLARSRGIAEINVDLVYGLPGQEASGFRQTVDALVAMNIDRIAVYGYAHVPQMRGNQRALVGRRPGPNERVALANAAREQLLSAGYVPVGFDHFALPHDPLARASAEGRLQRNFMGYTVSGGTDLLGLGVSSISLVDGAFAQNTTKLSRYHDALDRGQLPIYRGLHRTADDSIRANIIDALLCRQQVRRDEIQPQLPSAFNAYFACELSDLAAMARDGLVQDDGQTIRLTDTGRTFARSVARCFDRRSRQRSPRSFSQAI